MPIENMPYKNSAEQTSPKNMPYTNNAEQITPKNMPYKNNVEQTSPNNEPNIAEGKKIGSKFEPKNKAEEKKLDSKLEQKNKAEEKKLDSKYGPNIAVENSGSDSLRISYSDAEYLIKKLSELVTMFSDQNIIGFVATDSSVLSKEPDIKNQIDKTQNGIKNIRGSVADYLEDVTSVYAKVTDEISEADEYVKNNSTNNASAGAAAAGAAATTASGSSTSGGSTGESSTSGGSTSGSSTSGGSTSGGSTSGGSTSESSKSEKSTEESSKSELKRVSTPEASKSVGLVSALDISAEVLASYGVTKGSISSITKSENGYTISIKNQNADGKWKATDIKEYYIKDGSVSGAMTGNGTYIKIENGKIQIDESNSNIYSDVFSSTSGVASGTSSSGAAVTTESSINFANNTSYNTDANKAIFNQFYPNATDGEFNNFCSQISESQGSYSDAAKSVINAYKGDIADISSKNGYNYLVIENNTIKVDYKSVATELYAYESSKTGINFADGMGTKLSFNDSTATDLSEYVKQKYSVDVDFKSIVGNINDVSGVSTSSAVSNETSNM